MKFTIEEKMSDEIYKPNLGPSKLEKLMSRWTKDELKSSSVKNRISFLSDKPNAKFEVKKPFVFAMENFSSIMPHDPNVPSPPCTVPLTPVVDLILLTSQMNSIVQEMRDFLIFFEINLKTLSLKRLSEMYDAVNALMPPYGSLCVDHSNYTYYNDYANSFNTFENLAQVVFRTSFEIRVGFYIRTLGAEAEKSILLSQQVTEETRDFVLVQESYKRFQDELKNWTIESGTSGTPGTAWHYETPLFDRLDECTSAFEKAFEQIHLNIENERPKFDGIKTKFFKGLDQWANVDGQIGYDAMLAIHDEMNKILYPAFDAMISRCPSTPRSAGVKVDIQSLVTEINIKFAELPTFQKLYEPDGPEKYFTYDGSPKKDYAAEDLFAAIYMIAATHWIETGKTLSVNDLNYEHGGKNPPHASHRMGVDADMHPREIGIAGTPGFQRNLAIAFTKRILDNCTPDLVLFGDIETNNAANEIAGRIIFKYDEHHKDHFHIRLI